MPYNFAADSFHTKKLCSRLSSREVRFLRKSAEQLVELIDAQKLSVFCLCVCVLTTMTRIVTATRRCMGIRTPTHWTISPEISLNISHVKNPPPPKKKFPRQNPVDISLQIIPPPTSLRTFPVKNYSPFPENFPHLPAVAGLLSVDFIISLRYCCEKFRWHIYY